MDYLIIPKGEWARTNRFLPRSRLQWSNFHFATDATSCGTCSVDPTFVFLDIKAAFDSADRAILRRWLSLEGKRNSFYLSTPFTRTAEAKFVLAAVIHSISPRKVTLPHSLFIFNFFIELIMNMVPNSCENHGTNIRSDRKLCCLKYADDIVTEWRPKKIASLPRSCKCWCGCGSDALWTFEMYSVVAGLDLPEAKPCFCRETTRWSGHI